MQSCELAFAATDQAFGPQWLGDLPLLSAGLTYVVLVLQFAIPISVWFNRTRVPMLIVGAVFHLATALFMDIPEMGFAFIVIYPIWLSNDESERIKRIMTVPRIAY